MPSGAEGEAERATSDEAAPTAGPGRNSPRFDVRVVTSIDALIRAFTVRSLVYLSDQGCPYDEEFDGNDFAGLHVLAELDGEPIGTLRLRFFADFAKLERVALRKDFRQSTYARRLIRYGLEICRRKGYRQVYGHAQVRLLRFWQRFGFREMPGRDRFVFSDHEYTEILCPLDSHPDALHLGSDPMTMIRPEGEWDHASVLDQSTLRGASNPNQDHK